VLGHLGALGGSLLTGSTMAAGFRALKTFVMSLILDTRHRRNW
jgi:hypothetical protein